MSAPHAANPEMLDELDPHGFEQGHGQHKSHVIVGPFTLRTVLAALLVLTVLTAGQAQLEVYLTHAFDIEFPKWVNVVFCMSIAVIKALLVMGFFMQLRYDNPINSVIMAFTFFALALFLGFTSLDLTTRSAIYDWKATQIEPGGVSNATNHEGKSMVDYAKIKWKEQWGPEKFKEYEEDYHHAHALLHAGAATHGEDATRSSAQRTRPRAGLSGALDTQPAAPDTTREPAHAPAH